MSYEMLETDHITHYLRKEGGEWLEWPYGRSIRITNASLVPRVRPVPVVTFWMNDHNVITLHAFRLKSGRIWDTVNHWRVFPAPHPPKSGSRIEWPDVAPCWSVGDQVVYVGRTYTFPGRVCAVTTDGQVVVSADGSPNGDYRGMKHIFGPRQLSWPTAGDITSDDPQ